MGSKAQPDCDSITPLDCIFACSVCGDVFSEVYQQQDTVHGFSDGINPKERTVTRLYVASCCHVICIKHIGDGNGPAFHQVGQQPQASCPVCLKEKGDDGAKQLFSLRGFNDDEHDPAIPKCWFKAPPMKLEGKDKEMEALRFQYLALTRFSKNIATSYKEAVKNAVDAKTKLRAMQDLAAKEHEKAMSLQEEVDRLHPLQSEAQRLRRLEARLPAVRHYLGIIPMLKEQNDLMQQRLASLGFGMSLEPLPNFTGPLSLDEDGALVEDDERDAPMESRKTASSYTVGPSNDVGYVEEVEEVTTPKSHNHRPLKRSRVDSPRRAQNIHVAPLSRDMMPPPSGPLSKMKSIRTMIPTIRDKFSTGRSSRAQNHKSSSDPDVQMYDNGEWEAVNAATRRDYVDERPPTRHGPIDNTPYMSGALPVDDGGPRNSPSTQPGLLSGLGIHSNDSNFTFEAPTRMNMPSQRRSDMPTEPSYIRLLDGLGNHTGLDLGLEDPRGQDHEEYPVNHQPQQQTHQGDPGLERRQQKPRRAVPRIQTQHTRKQWNFGHAFLEQSPVNANSTSAQRYYGLQQTREANATMGKHQDRKFLNPNTPAPARSQRPADEVDHVVSPFFGSSSHHSQLFSRPRFAEPDVSSHRSADCQSHRPKPSMATDWREPRSLNSLSFFESTVNGRHERIDLRGQLKHQDYSPPLPEHRVRNINSEGLLMRPDAQRSPLQHDSTYGSLDRPYSRAIQTQPHSAIPFPAFGRPLNSRATASRLPSAMPSIITSRSPIHSRKRTETLGKVGVRSSQHSRPHISGNTFASPRKPVYSNAGRRVVRR
ncbi:hypothetical protein BU23DRAFT_542551 [Bimuria novae-zelandiae CBS 107.79]|uniref:Uncharacterized protein n=1 Tax=Bimuria novae-zelandiae CBS 107.79 TaxID=1447943 RepID=A0A6A5URW3_9PLEO|nr:hypothetical protein BU23DRAFT_542551 [Bimuria novae-zelandiae CBS 107.79]